MEILKKLYLFPERLRCMFLHLWCLGLRASEVCTLKGNAYYQQGEDYWIQVYQVKMKNYKRIPIPQALYQIMKVYLKILASSKETLNGFVIYASAPDSIPS